MSTPENERKWLNLLGHANKLVRLRTWCSPAKSSQLWIRLLKSNLYLLPCPKQVLEIMILVEMAVRMWMLRSVLGSHAMMALGRQGDTCLLLLFLPLVLAEMRSCAGNSSYMKSYLLIGLLPRGRPPDFCFSSANPKSNWRGEKMVQ